MVEFEELLCDLLRRSGRQTIIPDDLLGSVDVGHQRFGVNRLGLTLFLAAEIETRARTAATRTASKRDTRCIAYRGFDAQLLGGAVRTDVLLEAPLGRDESYRVSVDAGEVAGSMGSRHRAPIRAGHDQDR